MLITLAVGIMVAFVVMATKAVRKMLRNKKLKEEGKLDEESVNERAWEVS